MSGSLHSVVRVAERYRAAVAITPPTRKSAAKSVTESLNYDYAILNKEPNQRLCAK
jgi:hypothetical protein